MPGNEIYLFSLSKAPEFGCVALWSCQKAFPTTAVKMKALVSGIPIQNGVQTADYLSL